MRTGFSLRELTYREFLLSLTWVGFAVRHVPALPHYTEVHFASFLSGGFATMATIISTGKEN